MDSDGNIMKYHNCGSRKHCESSCFHRKVEETNIPAHITPVTGTTVSRTGSILVESLSKGILDSACTKKK